ncbi:response regulator [Myxococcus llanfairpwllgwyngyllgogerychwyrndrobwllllantysiliogogogochensis]|uniref:histidine kinase n=1 Tax=Myxococcus llanfairpwllgwyngyllgogerychwyrndrobwllllantysiliogogogochensis TaxID=2590453 RepID=A0A540X7D4_9BACT|nr:MULTISPECIES: ATP-binding protein [Myxococcus]NTX10171.1 PAS domain-containing protein [Myxococcus sp. CA056]TQF17193.1 response regulator [Myxococcus llanfairpwllgwyngyllgogerychwyrndrobwllllantysiliogogogochensis]
MSATDTRQAVPGADALLDALEEAERHDSEGCMVLRAVRDESGVITDFEWLWSNPAASRALGRGTDTLRGLRLKDISPIAGLGGRLAVLKQVVESGRPAADSFPEGDAWLLGTAVPLRDGVLLRLRDVTSALRMEEGLRDTLDWVRDVLESTPEAFFTVDAEWRITYVNRQAAEITGRTQEQVFRKLLWQACPELVGTLFERELRRVAAEGSSTIFEVRTAPDRWHEVHAWCSGQNVSVFSRDITGKKRAEAERDALLTREHSGRLEAEALVRERTEELVAARERLVQSEKLAMAGQLAEGVGHEINNPLSYVSGNLQFALEQLELSMEGGILGKNAPLAEALEALREAREGAERIRVIVRDLQTFARADEPHLSPVDVHAALEFGLSMAMPHLRYRAEVERRFAEVPTVMAHEARLGQVFLHLLVNAAHAIPEGDFTRHRVTLSTRVEGPWVVVEVADTGHGMTPEVAERVFEPFFTTRAVGEGSGLGLSTSLGMVRSMRGELTVNTTPGVGSTFSVRLPMTEAIPDAVTKGSTQEVPERKRVLVVDDEPQLASLLRRLLGQHHEVVVRHSGREALALLEQDADFDRVFCDLMMADVTGMDLHAELLSRGPELLSRFVFMTGGAFTERARAFLQTVPLPRIEKPFDPGTLRALVEGAPPRARALGPLARVARSG